ncbi:MAG: YciI family protein [Candidatus Thorarchaeota archaeon]|nr:YciI family protein [Candidatus Thorarchaeota archaeon]
MSETKSFVIMLRPAPDYGTDGTDEIASQHFEYLKRLNKEGKVRMAGRFAEVLIGLVMLEVESIEEAKVILRNGPTVKANVFHAELYPWSIALGS